MRKKFLSILFFISFAALWIIAEGVEQGYITSGQTIVALAIDAIIIAISGFGSGVLVAPQKRKEPDRWGGTDSLGKK